MIMNALQSRVRDFVEKEVLPFVQQWEEEHISNGKEFPLEVLHKAVAAGIYAPQYVARILLQDPLAHRLDRRSPHRGGLRFVHRCA